MINKKRRIIQQSTLLVLIIIGAILFCNLSPKGIDTEVSCYDNYNKEIVGVTCLDNKWDNLRTIVFSLSTVISFLVIVYIILTKEDII